MNNYNVVKCPLCKKPLHIKEGKKTFRHKCEKYYENTV